MEPRESYIVAGRIHSLAYTDTLVELKNAVYRLLHRDWAQADIAIPILEEIERLAHEARTVAERTKQTATVAVETEPVRAIAGQV